ncbi:MAG: acetate kinase [Oscillospiraceae bacterium]|jgi:acetate kinase|nr:acetate kinase [Oscillospiraceae bacterium]
MKVLVINAGSSSVKYQLIDMTTETLIAKGLCEKIGIAPGSGHMKHSPQNGKPAYEVEIALPTHTDAIKAVLEKLVSPEFGVVSSLSDIGAVGHRVLNGGPKYAESALVDASVIKDIEYFIPLGPLHNPHNLSGIRACIGAMPGVPQVATFDTSFHQTMPDYAYTYAIPYKYQEKYHIRRYGFHGTSHKYVSQEAVKLLGAKAENTRIITCHLGNGSSLAAIRGGKCIDTSMGLTPLEGVPMGTRSGSIDPAIVEYIADSEKLTVAETLHLLNHESGVLGISGVSSDFREIEAVAENGGEPLYARANLALKVFYYNVMKYLASYYGALGGADAIVFTAGLGENSAEARAEITKPLAGLGISLDPEKNKVRGTVDITGNGSKVRIFTIPTNEELMIARDTKAIVER